MKKFKVFNILLILAIIFSMPIAYAHDIELDKDDVITIPLDSKGQLASSTKVKIDEEYKEYDLYYQYVRFDGDNFESFISIHEEALEYQEENMPTEESTEEEKEEYADTIESYEASKNALKPEFVEENWLKSTDGTVPFVKGKDEQVKEGDSYILWVKLSKAEEESIYDELWVIYNEGMEKEEAEPSPETSDNIMVIGILAVAALGVMAVSYNKSRA